MKTFKDINGKTPEQMAVLKKYYDNPLGFLLLAGSNGNGKSFCAEVIYQSMTSFELPKRDWDQAIFIPQSELNETWQYNFPDNRNLSEQFKNSPLVVFDDLGTRPPPEGFLNFLYSLVEYRWRNREKCGTIITTNLNAGQMEQQFGAAFLSRAGSGDILKFEGEDRRLKYNF